MLKPLVIITCFIFLSCKDEIKQDQEFNSRKEHPYKIFTKKSDLKNNYIGFNSPKAINEIASIENEYFNSYQNYKYSKYYGTIWAESATNNYIKDSINVFKFYTNKFKNIKLDSMHCTIYAIKALHAGLDSNFVKLKNHHKRIWKNREFAGWSVAYILTKYFNWSAYLIISEQSSEYDICIKNFKKDKKYHVWKQPNIPVKQIFNFNKDKKQIDSLLMLNEFGWGFSKQGWHTWITRFKTLKECNWNGSPSKKLNFFGNKPLFLKTEFSQYIDYNSHVIVFPPKIKD